MLSTAIEGSTSPTLNLSAGQHGECAAPLTVDVGEVLRDPITLDELTFGGEWARQLVRERFFA